MKKLAAVFSIIAGLAGSVIVVGCSKAPEAAAVPLATEVANVSDIDVNEHVKTALVSNVLLKGVDIQVVTLKGDVRLIGVLDTQTQIDEAIKVARAADGTHTIHDELTLKK